MKKHKEIIKDYTSVYGTFTGLPLRKLIEIRDLSGLCKDTYQTKSTIAKALIITLTGVSINEMSNWT